MKSFQKNLILTILILICVACQTESSPAKTEPTANNTEASAPKGLEPPKQRYLAQWLDGQPFDSNNFPGEKIIFAYFNFRNAASLPMLKTLEQLKDKQDEYHFHIIPVSVNSDEKAEVEKFLKDNGISYRTLLEDKELKLASQLKVANEVSLVGLNNDHDILFNLKKFVPDPSDKQQKEFLSSLQEALHIKTDVHGRTKPYLGINPKAPDFTAQTIDNKTFRLSDFKGKAKLLVFFSPRCPHCQHLIAYLNELITPEFKNAGFEMIGVSLLSLKDPNNKGIFDSLKMQNWSVIDDSTRQLWPLYMQTSGFPETFYINRDGQIEFYEEGFNESDQHLKVIEMRLRKMLGLDNPPLLSGDKYNGVESCLICHGDEYASWAVTKHAHAWETLEIKGQDNNLECAGCHSIGMNQSQGWIPSKNKKGEPIALVPEIYQNVQCEHCHGIGGPHAGNPHGPEDMQKNCLECHTEKFSLHFDYNERVQKVNHSNKDTILKLTPDERLALLAKVSKNPHELFGSKIKYVGSDKCLDCHTDTHKAWQNSAHAKAFESLKAQNKTTDQNCLQCHTVGLNQPGGYQENLTQSYEGVGCESCHGPGEAHVLSKKKQDIRGLGDDCPFCVIEQICLSCHDATNDPHFNIYKGLEEIKGHK